MRLLACTLVLSIGCAAEPAPIVPSSDAADAAEQGADTTTDTGRVEPCPFEAGQACTAPGGTFLIGQCSCGGVDWRAVCCKRGVVEITICSDGIHIPTMCGDAGVGVVDADAAGDADAVDGG